tara:strand:- start:13981 stop:14592 length:612 start_codon:yes stop_codon:yes gene_type:complete
MDYVYLKLQSYDSDNLSENIIPLKVESVVVDVSKTIPTFNIPFSGLLTGESETIALDLGMSTKNITLTGVILDESITKNFGDGAVTYNMTAQEIAQLIASGVDSTGIAKHQAFSELVVLIPSNIASDYSVRANPETLIPLNFSARGSANRKDNDNVPLPSSDFPDDRYDSGISGFVESFNFTLASTAVELGFTLTFRVATLIP